MAKASNSKKLKREKKTIDEQIAELRSDITPENAKARAARILVLSSIKAGRYPVEIIPDPSAEG